MTNTKKSELITRIEAEIKENVGNQSADAIIQLAHIYFQIGRAHV